MNRENKSWYVILGIISKRPMSGYDVKQLINKISNFYWSENNAQIYPILKKLEAENLVTSTIDEKSGARNRRIYSITKAGLIVLKEWLSKPAPEANYREEILIKLSLGQHLSNAVNLKHIQNYKDQLIVKQKQLVEAINHIESKHQSQADYKYLRMTYNYSKLIIEARIEWCKQTLKELKNLK